MNDLYSLKAGLGANGYIHLIDNEARTAYARDRENSVEEGLAIITWTITSTVWSRLPV